MELKNTVHVGQISTSDLKLRKNKEAFPVIKVLEGQIVTEEILVEIPGGEFFTPDAKSKKIAVVERHGRTGQIGVGVITNFAINGGAIASSVAHDSHNIIVIGDNDEDMLIAINELLRTQGGYTIVANGQVYDTLELPILGLISDAGYECVTSKVAIMTKKSYEMGLSKEIDPFTTLSFMALPVIPELRITPRGLYRVREKELFR